MVERARAQVKPGSIVEDVAKNSEAERAGLQQGDVLLSWSRGDEKGKINSPFDLSLIEIEQAPRGNVSLQGLRGTEKQAWVMGPDDWGIAARPNLPRNLLPLYLEGKELSKAGKWGQAVKRWRSAATEVRDLSSTWLRSWLFFHAAEELDNANQWQKADDCYQEALAEADAATPLMTAQLLRRWAISHERRGDLPNAGKYYEQAVAETERLGDEDLFAALSLENLANFFRQRSELTKAEEYCHRALTIQQKLAPASLPVARTLATLGITATAAGDLTSAKNYEQQALTIQEKLAPGSLKVAGTLFYLGVVSYYQGELESAEHYHEQALTIQQKLAPSSLEFSATLNNLGLALFAQGEIAKAQECWQQALVIREKLVPVSIYFASTLNNLGMVAWMRGDLTTAEAYYRQSLAIDEKLTPGSLRAAEDIANLGAAVRDAGDNARAEKYYREALEIQEKKAPDNIDTADTFIFLGEVLKDDGDLTRAEECYRKALQIQEREAPGSLYLANSLSHLGDVARDRRDYNAAEHYYGSALAIREKLAPESEGYAELLANLAEVRRGQQQSNVAAQLYEQALNVLESQVTRLGGGADVRSRFRAKHTDYYRNYVDLLISQKTPELAFGALERQHARALLEMLTEAHLDIHKGIEPLLLQRERLLEGEITAKSNRRVSMLSSQHTEEQAAAIDNEVHELVSRYHDVQEQIRSGSPAYAALTHPESLNVEQVQQQLLDADTLLLEYSLGKERSYVFAVTQDSFVVRELPKQNEIESLARSAHALLTARSHIRVGESILQQQARISKADEEYANIISRLSQILLGPIASQLQGKRLLIVSDGALQYVPFSVLPEPGSNSRPLLPLIAGHEIVNLPSASVLAILRRNEMGRTPPSKAVAVVADPVFDTKDTRIRQRNHINTSGAEFRDAKAVEQEDTATMEASESRERLTRSIADLGNGELHLGRLIFTRREAKAIMDVIPAGTGMEALDFKASRATATSPDLAQYRIVHFATHGLLDSEHPELSGLVLSMVDERGRPENGYLELQDIYNLNLPAELVVLSGCETALGKEVNGEGLVGLTRGFMYAGATRVVASLWKVDDVATAELMRRFYRAMEQEEMRPAAALRQAQVEMREQPRWASPYYWAGFELEGEWK